MASKLRPDLPSPTACALPWTGFSNDPDGRVRPCCIFKGYIQNENGEDYFLQQSGVEEIFNSQFMKNLRQEFIDGRRPGGCETCWVDESNGYTSKRQRYLGHFEKFRVDVEAPLSVPVEYQLILNNTCNLACRSCDPTHSIKWESEVRKRGLEPNRVFFPKGQVASSESFFWNHRSDWMKTLRRLEVVGGEPFVTPEWFQLWDEMIQAGASRGVALDLCTNVLVFKPDWVRKLAENFEYLGISLSVDGLGPIYDYLRFGGRWEQVYQNLKGYLALYRELWSQGRNGYLQFSHTIGWMNALYLPEFHEFVYREFGEIAIFNNVIHHPPHMALWMMPTQLKERIEERWRRFAWDARYRGDIEGLIQIMKSRQPSDAELHESWRDVLLQDQFRKEDFEQVFPEVAEIIGFRRFVESERRSRNEAQV